MIQYYTARGRTNIELREKFFLAEGVSQTMATFTAKTPMKSPTSSHSGSAPTAKTSSTVSGPIMKVSRLSFITAS